MYLQPYFSIHMKNIRQMAQVSRTIEVYTGATLLLVAVTQ